LVENGESEAARGSFEAALARDPDYRDAHVNLAFVLAASGQLAAAEPHFARATALDSLDLDARHSWAVALAQLGRDLQAREVLGALLDEVSITDALRARTHADLGRLAEKGGRGAEALEHLTAAVAGFPEDLGHRRALAGVLGRMGQFEEAAAQLTEVVKRAPEDVESRFGAVMALLLGTRFNEARALLEEGLSDQPAGQPAALPLRHLLARVLATAPDDQARDGVRALALAQEVFRDTRNLDHAQTVAMAFAEAGDFASAIAWQERVIAQARQVGRTPIIARAERRLARYRVGEPVRSPWKDG
jgi:tetratricopeptide (TPR) repeat protein